jgi:DNA-binding winged helix-turn-helix (wHTH) protein/tetratricopeptide (TPR) repeat protein
MAQAAEMPTVHRFGACELDAAMRELRRDGHVVEVQRKVFDLLLYLVEHRHRAVDKDEIQRAVWPGVIVTETALTRAIMKARRAVGDDAERQAVIRTVHGHGYRFVALLEGPAIPEPAPPAPEPPAGDAARRRRFGPAAWLTLAGALAALAAGLAIWRAGDPSPQAGATRVAVLPIEDRTGDPDLAWVRLGLMGLVSQMLRASGVDTVPARSVLALAEPGDPAATGEKLREVYGATHVAAATLARGGGLYRFTYVVTGPDGSGRERTLVGDDAARLARDLGRDLMVNLVGRGLGRGLPSQVSADPFVNEAYARGLSLQLGGRTTEAQELFRVAMEQASDAFWPRYEYALSARDLGHHAEARSLLEALRAEARAAGDPIAEASATNGLGILLWRDGDPAGAEAAFAEGLPVAVRGGDLQLQSAMLVNSAMLARDRGENELARRHIERALELDRRSGIANSSGTAFNTLATVAMREGRLDEAEEALGRALESFRLLGNRRFEAASLNNLGSLRLKQGRWDEAESLHRAALELRESIGDLRGKSSSLQSLAAVDLARGRLSLAEQHAAAALELAHETSSVFTEAMAAATLGEIALERGRPAAARAHFLRARGTLERLQDRPAMLERDLDLARVALAENDGAAAAGLAAAVAAEARERNFRPQLAAALQQLGRIRLAGGDAEGGAAALSEALDVARHTGDPSLQAQAALALAAHYLAAGALAEAEPLVQLAERDRPLAADTLRLRSRRAELQGDAAAALGLLEQARSAANELWTDTDQSELDRLRAGLATAQH